MNTITAPQSFGKVWQTLNLSSWAEWADARRELHEAFVGWITERRNTILSVLEVGCGPCHYLRAFPEVFEDIEYTGLDISRPAIEDARSAFPKRTFICSDFLDLKSNKKYDLVFSHAAIDHTHHPDMFFRKCVEMSNRYVFVGAYNGLGPTLDSHRESWDDMAGCYNTMLSPTVLMRAVSDIVSGGQVAVESFHGEGAIIVDRRAVA